MGFHTHTKWVCVCVYCVNISIYLYTYTSYKNEVYQFTHGGFPKWGYPKLDGF